MNSPPDDLSFVRCEFFQIVRTVLNLPDLVLTDTSSASDVAGWDSFMMVEMVATAEERFQVEIESRDLDNFRNVGDLVHRIADKRRTHRE